MAVNDDLPTWRYRLREHPSEITISTVAQQTFSRYQQHGGSGLEAGGQLFAQIDGCSTHIVLATDPSPKDKRWWNLFVRHQPSERQDIAIYYQHGLHYVGDWHTHPEPIPHYSGTDITSARKCFIASTHQLRYLLMLIVGYGPLPGSCRIWAINRSEEIELRRH